MIDTENATDILAVKYLQLWQTKKISQIKHSDTTNILHRRQLHVMRQVNRKMMMMMMMIMIIITRTTKADKGRTVVIIDKDVI